MVSRPDMSRLREIAGDVLGAASIFLTLFMLLALDWGLTP